MSTEKSEITFTPRGIFTDLVDWIDYRLNLVDDPKKAGELLYNEFKNLKEMAETNLSVIEEGHGEELPPLMRMVSLQEKELGEDLTNASQQVVEERHKIVERVFKKYLGREPKSDDLDRMHITRKKLFS